MLPLSTDNPSLRGAMSPHTPHVSIQAVLVSRAPPHDLDPCDVKYLCAIKTVSNSVTGDSVATLSHVTQRARPCSKHFQPLLPL